MKHTRFLAALTLACATFVSACQSLDLEFAPNPGHVTAVGTGDDIKHLGRANFGSDTAVVQQALDISRVAWQQQVPVTPHALQYLPSQDPAGKVAVIDVYDRTVAKTRGRLDITVNPAGWPARNPKVEVTFSSGKTYRGYAWNRSHLVADSLGGLPTADNMITGTRNQNVGDNTGKGGMAYAESLIREFLDQQNIPMQRTREVYGTLTASGVIADKDGNLISQWNAAPMYESCAVAYKVSPQVATGEVIPRSVRIDMKSCDGTINERVEVPNTLPGYAINYVTGMVYARK